MASDPRAQKIDNYLRSKGSPLAGQGATFVKHGRQYGVDPFLLVAISGQESSFGKHQYRSHNAWGWGGMDFPSYDAAIGAVAKGLHENYIGQGLTTITAIWKKYAPVGASNDPTGLNSNWPVGVKRFYAELGGKSPGARPSPIDASGPMPAALPPVPSQPMPSAMPAMPAMPDMASFALGNLSDLASGSYSPQHSLSKLVESVAMGQAQAPAPIPPQRPEAFRALQQDPHALTVPSVSPPSTLPKNGGGIVQSALRYLNVPYTWGGNDAKSGLDCSGYVIKIMRENGVDIGKFGRTTWDLVKHGAAVAPNQMKTGDVVYWDWGGQSGPEHMGIYIGNGKYAMASGHAGEVQGNRGGHVKVVPVSQYAKPSAIRRYT